MITRFRYQVLIDTGWFAWLLTEIVAIVSLGLKLERAGRRGGHHARAPRNQ